MFYYFCIVPRRGALKLRAEIILLEPDPGNAGVGNKKLNHTFLLG